MANRYFVPGGDGNYNSNTNWSAISGGASGASVPTTTDDVKFDANSFVTSGQIVTIPSLYTAQCHDMDWAGALHSPTLNFASPGGTSDMEISGSCALISSLNITSNGSANSFSFISSETGKTVDFKGISFPVDVIFRNFSGGDFTLLSNITLNGSGFGAVVIRGSQIVYGNGKIITIPSGGAFQVTQDGDFNCVGTPSAVHLNASGSGDVEFDFSSSIPFSGDLTVVFNNTGSGNWRLNDTTIGLNSYKVIDITGIGYFVERDFIIDNLIIHPGSNVQAGFTNTLTVNTFTANGTSGNHIILTSDSAGDQFFINATNVSVSYIDVMDSYASGSIPFVDSGGVDNGNNTNWTFPAAVTSTPGAAFLLNFIQNITET